MEGNIFDVMQNRECIVLVSDLVIQIENPRAVCVFVSPVLTTNRRVDIHLPAAAKKKQWRRKICCFFEAK